MCVLYLAFEQRPDYPLILLANRDEFYDRPSAPARFWDDAPNVYAGRDLKEGGTWLGVARNGKFAAVTNYRDPLAPAGIRSRGDLVADFLKGAKSPADYVAEIDESSNEYSGFNLITGELNTARREIAYLSNRSSASRLLEPGVYGLSNHLLDTPWPKVVKGKERLASLLRSQELDRDKCFHLLADSTTAADHELPSTGIPHEIEKAISAIFIAMPGYGTRCSSMLTFDKELNWKLDERTWV